MAALCGLRTHVFFPNSAACMQTRLWSPCDREPGSTGPRPLGHQGTSGSAPSSDAHSAHSAHTCLRPVPSGLWRTRRGTGTEQPCSHRRPQARFARLRTESLGSKRAARALCQLLLGPLGQMDGEAEADLSLALVSPCVAGVDAEADAFSGLFSLPKILSENGGDVNLSARYAFS